MCLSVFILKLSNYNKSVNLRKLTSSSNAVYLQKATYLQSATYLENVTYLKSVTTCRLRLTSHVLLTVRWRLAIKTLREGIPYLSPGDVMGSSAGGTLKTFTSIQPTLSNIYILSISLLSNATLHTRCVAYQHVIVMNMSWLCWCFYVFFVYRDCDFMLNWCFWLLWCYVPLVLFCLSMDCDFMCPWRCFCLSGLWIYLSRVLFCLSMDCDVIFH